MRLTLRTLLAFMDKLLEPSAMQAMQQKLDESPAAAELVHRIRDVTKKVRLAAPSVEGKGLGLDPNTVAEYLDNTLPGERTPDFEMVCLESDVHLAEVAACHEILSLVLVKPAAIDPSSRQKMYDVINEKPVAAKPVATPAEPAPATAVPVAAAVAAPVAAEPARKPQVPDYLRDSQPLSAVQARRGWQLAVVAALILLLVGGTAVLALVPVDSVPGFLQPISRLLHPGSQVAQVDDETETPLRPAVVTAATADAPNSGAPETSTSDAAAGDLRQPDSVVVPPSTDVRPATDVATDGELRQPASAVSPSADALPGAATTVPPTPGDPAIPAAATPIVPGSTPALPGAHVVDTTVTGVPAGTTVMPAPGTTVVVPVTPGATPGTTPTESTVPGTTLPDVTTPPTPTVPKVESIGRVSSPVSQVVLRFDGAQNAWVRLPAREQLSVGDRLLTMPDYRSQVALANGVTVDMLGGTLVQFTEIDAAGTPGLMLLRGRLILYTVGGAKALVRLDNSPTPTTFILSAAELGLEFVPRRAPGADPGLPQPWLVRLYANSGDVAWSSGGEPVPLKAPSTAVMTDATPPTAEPTVGEFPRWLTHDDRDLLQKQAADAIEARLRSDKAVSVALREILDERPVRYENVQLALRCLAQIGEFADFMPLLHDPTQRYSAWDRYVYMLVEAIDFGPSYAEAVRTVLVTQHGDEGDKLYRMLWSYSDEQLAAGAAQMLVETLDHAELDFRVVAYWTLCDITGLNLTYLPQDADAKRRPNVQKWEAKRAAGELVRKAAP